MWKGGKVREREYDHIFTSTIVFNGDAKGGSGERERV